MLLQDLPYRRTGMASESDSESDSESEEEDCMYVEEVEGFESEFLDVHLDSGPPPPVYAPHDGMESRGEVDGGGYRGPRISGVSLHEHLQDAVARVRATIHARTARLQGGS